MNPRLAGGFIPELVRHAEGVDLIRETLRLVLSETSRPTARHRRHASIRFLFPPGPGRLTAVEGLDVVRSIPHVLDVGIYPQIGETVSIRGDFRDRIGHVITCADTFDAAASSSETGRDSIRVIVEPAEAALERGS